ncbi:fumarylacetoacetate hydrolase family protein [Kitasatospora aureofaciens]|uniref:Gentisate 1,2-dioxygenase n=1 Tax=Kitasatospora aureofaciens TaxID=1894 RepID=A0A1E7NCN7_KITAU|nr:fumarylacetoacetate hydrolase family protein [Kitasatospora aureofaciens]QEU98599.1 FAA hydrolase family protein [Streptomyces viridifaciens]ARF82144.1 ureidoglycolate lyase [Kitasatospora aureofaciens]OEV38459.1 ureidoglycolate lyase [Kitasatospora aureofaciens]UKZ04555.1 fumarylacetoacetate hydrolase family protein [Streptomyces viridifaciens]GGU84894.1 gentisate 1,2-dioxygenase [Kitasatospora aureofaciens]
MHLLTYCIDGDETPRLGARIGADRVADLTALASAAGVQLPGSVLELIRAGKPALSTARQLLGDAPDTRPLAEVSLRAPLRPGKIVGVGLNYVEHVDESHRSLDTDRELPDRPVLFGKPATAVTGHGQPILHNADLTKQLDWECELAVVIGEPARRVSEQDAWRHVFGYSIVNDVSARDQRRSGQWFFSKGQDSYAPFGPVVVTADEIPDPQRLDLSLRVNGELRQNSNTRHMLFGIARLIADISAGMTLEPGDVIATGSPSGVGAGMVPPQFLQPGDLVEATIERIGTLANPVIDAR